MTRHQIETAAVAHFTKLLRTGKAIRPAMRALENKMFALGYDDRTAYLIARDVADMAELNLLAEAA